MPDQPIYSAARKLRSRDWLEPLSGWGMVHRGWLRAEGFDEANFRGKPVIGICNSWSELTNCNSNLRSLAEAVKRGVWQAGGFPLEFPTMSLGEPFMKPTTMLFRNLMAMDVEESIDANPLDAVVLLAGCDKTVPAQILGALSANVPALMVTSGPMLRSSMHGKELGSGHDLFEYLNAYKSGQMTREELGDIEGCISRSTGHCMVMGTASTMACLVEALGFTLPGGASIPGPDARRLALAERAGKRAVELALQDIRPQQIITPRAIENAIRVLHAIGGSTNAIIHLIAFARRLGLDLPMEYFDKLGEDTPFFVNLNPSGKFVMEDFHSAGGMQAVLKEIQHLLNHDALTVTGETMGQWLAKAKPSWNREVIGSVQKPIQPQGAVVTLRGSLAPNGAVIKRSAASQHLLKHRGPAYVFENFYTMLEELNDLNLPVTKDSVLVLRNAGPVGAPGMPEWGVFGVPLKLYQQGVHDVVRISDARISGTSHGTIIVHVAPESAVGGPLALVKTGDLIELDVESHRIDLLVDAGELEKRRKEFRPPPARERGYKKLYVENVLQANEGVDFGFLVPPKLEPFPMTFR